MRNLDRKHFHRSIFSVCLFTFAFLMSYPIIGTNIITIILVTNWLLEGYLKRKMLLLIQQKLAFLTIIIFFIYAISLFYSQNVPVGLRLLETKLSILLLTLVVVTSKPSLKQLHITLICFSLGVLTISLKAWFLFYNDHLAANNLGDILAQGAFRDIFTLYTAIHPTYFTYYLLFSTFSIFYLLYNYYRNISNYIIFAAVVANLYFLTQSLLLSSRMPLAVFILIASGTVMYNFVIKRKYIALFFSISAVVISLILMLQTPLLNLRFKEIQETAFVPPQGIHHNSTNIRIALYNCAFLGLEDNWAVGLGVGSVQDFLNNCYQNNNYSDVLYKDEYDVHNAYIDIWLATGISGIFILLIFYIIAIQYALTHKRLLYLAFILFFSLCSLTESTLNTNKGVVFFSFFNSILAFSSKRNFTFKRNEIID